MQRVLKGKSDSYKQLIYIIQHVHFQIRVVVKTKIYFVMFDIVVKNKSIVVKRGVVITVVKIYCGSTRLRLVSPQHFDHCDDTSLSIRVHTTLNHIRFVKNIIHSAK